MRLLSLKRSLPALAFMAACLCPASTVRADRSASDMSRRLAQIQANVQSSEREIDTLKTQYADLLKEQRESESAVQRLREEEKHLEVDLKQLERRHDELIQGVEQARAAAEERQRQIEKRLRALYIGAAPMVDTSVLWRADHGGLERIAIYIRAIRASDRAHFDEVRKAFEVLKARQEELASSMEKQKSVQVELKSKREAAQGEAAKLKRVLDQINTKKRNAERALQVLKEEGERLEAMMAALTNGEIQPPPAPEITATIAPRETVKDTSSTTTTQTEQPPQLLGLFVSKAKISPPVKGRVLQRFGKVRVSNFSDIIFSKGLEYNTATGAEVYAIADGRVVYAGEMPGYGMVVVLDHGARSYSLYGRLQENSVTIGQTIRRDAVIGTVSEPDGRDRSFYFEVRKNGAPVDPVKVLKRTSR